MTREDLTAILEGDGDTASKVTQILNRGNAEARAARGAEAQAQREKAEELEGKLKAARTENRELKAQVKEAQSASEALEESNAVQLRQKEEIERIRIQAAIDVAIARAGIRNEKTEEIIRQVIGLSDIKVNKDGTVTGVEEKIQALKDDEQTAYLFGDTPTPRQRYEPVAGDKPSGKSIGRMMAELEMKERPADLNATFEGAIIGAGGGA